jgi:hypothetical protein
VLFICHQRCRLFQRLPVAVVACFAGCVVPSTHAAGTEFRVESTVYGNSRTTPIHQTVTLFDEAVVYDFAHDRPDKMTVFRLDEAAIDMVDLGEMKRTRVTHDDLMRYVAEIETRVTKLAPPLQAMVAPRLQQRWNEESRQLSLSNRWVSYRAVLATPAVSEMAGRYRTFADWCARLNVTHPDSMPPAARLALNKAVARRGMVPEQVELSVTLDGGKTISRRSRHVFAAFWRDSDRQRVKKLESGCQDCQNVSLYAYYRSTNPAQSAKLRR